MRLFGTLFALALVALAMLASQRVPSQQLAAPVQVVRPMVPCSRPMFRMPSKTPRGRRDAMVAKFKFLKDLGIKKPDFLPDFGGPKKARMAEAFVLNGFPASERAPTFEATIGGEVASAEELAQAAESMKSATDFNAQPYDEETLERVITFTANGKTCELRMTQEGKILSATL
eukprot:CAMPEP_0170177880 /NCGR_PEP_ID=MMETSP0040_2-20121228/11276_1 /TAXON_ID=641309 /ORGANISM="Lotharella oceanica, Strain CCMP622" /LENGTH=172 /DNA_ID=CAMNT_0010420727 /DNA_START=25 /DNA_END=543 /DNA_ORIENTATION=+